MEQVKNAEKVCVVCLKTRRVINEELMETESIALLLAQFNQNKFEQIVKFGENCTIDKDQKKRQEAVLNRFSFKFTNTEN